jgi:cytochrome c oxidase subunit 3
MLPVATASAIEATPRARANRPNLVSVGTIVWLSSELMFFAALFAMYFTIRSVTKAEPHGEWPGTKLNLPFDTFNTVVLVLSSVTCQLGVFAAERGDVRKLRIWYVVSLLMGLWFVIGQAISYTEQVQNEGLTLSSSAYGSVFYLTTGFHGLHVTGGLIAFLFVLGRTYAAKRWTHEQATSAIVVSYYWHFVDVVWIGLFSVIFLIK